MRVFVLADSEAQCAAIDQQLWMSSDTNFIPHALAGSPAANSQLSKIHIGQTLSDVSGFDFLVNLGCQDDIEGKDFTRIAELVSADPAHKQAARMRYAAWRDAGAELNTHNIQIS
jgi:DNA polymerase-3 subunit chi